jgi:hypothetical protein
MADNAQTLLACYRSGQMSEAQMVAHTRENPEFAKYFREREKTRATKYKLNLF